LILEIYIKMAHQLGIILEPDTFIMCYTFHSFRKTLGKKFLSIHYRLHMQAPAGILRQR